MTTTTTTINHMMMSTTIVVMIMITTTIMTNSTFAISDDQQNNESSNNATGLDKSLNKLLTDLSSLNDRLIRIETIVKEIQQWQHQHHHHHHHNYRDDDQSILINRLQQHESDHHHHHQSIQSQNDDNFESTGIMAATCHMRPNRHLALLNQQDIHGEIYLTQQIATNPAIINMQIRLQGFKVGCDSTTTETNVASLKLNNSDCNAVTTTTTTTTTTTLNEAVGTKNKTFAFGMHIHEGSDLSYDCQSVGNHYNPLNMTHGGPTDSIRHLGDLGNIYADQQGVVSMDNLQFTNLSLNPNDEHCIINRTIVIHNGRDDYGRNTNAASKITGNSGIRIACCLITLLEQRPSKQQQQQQQTTTTTTFPSTIHLSSDDESIQTTTTTTN
ncbi:hypothetical protein DERF_004557 [Dermatophagoides farinae]|uniref:Superoxide dismutase [Cu-Zn] n=1 Tax=Dermatophagoides farinae TaxID=6954 RepID=A0A922I456_DERFA|nr:hypothetical protein DERF_004557 [Dermatophagoides farinae]